MKEKIVTEEQFRFGQPTRPSTPMYGVMGNLYGRVAAEVQGTVYDARPQSAAHTKDMRKGEYRKPNKAYNLFKDSIGKRLPSSSQPSQEFKITKFNKVAPRTNTNRNDRRSHSFSKVTS